MDFMFDEENKQRPINENSYTLKAFKSTPNFIQALTDLGVKVLNDTEHENKKDALIKDLNVIN